MHYSKGHTKPGRWDGGVPSICSHRRNAMGASAGGAISEITVVMRRRPTPEAIQAFHCESLLQRSLNVKQRGHGCRPVAPRDLAALSWRIRAILRTLSKSNPSHARWRNLETSSWQCGYRDAACMQGYWPIQMFRQ
jgi:hypothetical protein